MSEFNKRQQQLRQQSSCASASCVLKAAGGLFLGLWLLVVYVHVGGSQAATGTNKLRTADVSRIAVAVDRLDEVTGESHVPFEETDESYHIVFSTGCSEFQDWQSIGVYSSAEAVGQRGIITRIASGCNEKQMESLRHAMSHLPKRCRIHFAPDTDVKDHAGHFYKYANKPLGMMHWLMHASPKIPPDATVALVDPDFYFLKPLWHDSFASPDKYFATGRAKQTPMPRDPVTGQVKVVKGSMIAQRYGIGGKPWTKAAGRNNQKAWALDEYFASVGRPDSPAVASDLMGNEGRAGDFFSIGAPYFAVASDWLPIATSWTNLMYMSVERNFGNLAEMYAMVIAVADYGIRPAMLDSLMVSNVDADDEGWPWIDKLPSDRACDPYILKEDFAMPTFLHYCQTYVHPDLEPNPGSKFSKYQVPDEILACPSDSLAAEAGNEQDREGKMKRKSKGNRMPLDADGFLPEPDVHSIAANKIAQRNVFAYCFATRGTNQAARDYRTWFCTDQ